MATYQNKGKQVREIAHAIDPNFPVQGDKINDEGEALGAIRDAINSGWGQSEGGASSLENGSGTKAVQQKQDGTSGTFDFTDKNPNATALDPTLTGQLPYGATGDYSSSFGGKGQASGKRSFQTGTTTIAKGNYSFASGDNSVALGSDSSANNYQTVAAGLASFSTGYSTQVTGVASFVSGTRNKVDGGNAAAFGNDNNANHNNQFVIGYFNYNKVGTLFEIGNGTSAQHSNAFEVYDDGTLGIPNFDSDGNKIGMKKIKCINGVLTVID